MNTIHIVDDDAKILESLDAILSKEGYHVETSESPELFLKKIEAEPPGVVILDIFFGEGGLDGESLVKILKERFPNIQAIMMSGESDIKKTLSCLKEGALDFLEKPVSLHRLITTVRNAFALFHAKESAQSRYRILGKSLAIKEVIKRIQKLATLNESVLICGENGTGKELIAENLHLFSNRYALPMVKVNLTALNVNVVESELFGHKKGSFTGATEDKKGFFEVANQSSLFIDEIGDFPLNLQSKILRVLQEKKIMVVGSTKEVEIDTRLIFATNKNLETMIKEATFRQDLYFRISTFTVELPPLRDRLEDIDILAPHFLNDFLIENNLEYKVFSPDAIEKLKQHHYPGNIRELAKIIKNSTLFSENEVITAQDIEFQTEQQQMDIWLKTRNLSLTESKKCFEKEFLIKRLKQMNRNIEKTAESLGIIRNNLYRKLREYDIEWN